MKVIVMPLIPTTSALPAAARYIAVCSAATKFTPCSPPPKLGLKERSREEAWETREREARDAARVMRLAAVEFLRCPDWTLGDDIRSVSAKLAPVPQRVVPHLIYLPHSLRKHSSQVSQWDYVRAVRGLNEFHGAMAGRCRYAKVFQEVPHS